MMNSVVKSNGFKFIQIGVKIKLLFGVGIELNALTLDDYLYR